ncbi:MAG: hypothetical protein IT538_01245 [Variibacter sp.]|nr:hypothetical protein [Variibacter sp.]
MAEREGGRKPATGQSTRQQRLQAALRENLRRRKQQARGRAGEEPAAERSEEGRCPEETRR